MQSKRISYVNLELLQREPWKHTNLSRSQTLLVWRPYWILTNILHSSKNMPHGSHFKKCRLNWVAEPGFSKKGWVTWNANSFSYSGCQRFRLTVLISFWKTVLQRGVCVSKTATEIVSWLIFQVTALDELYNLDLLALRIAMLLNNLKIMPHCSHFKDDGHFKYFTTIFWSQLF
jgi:hypothetical protein